MSFGQRAWLDGKTLRPTTETDMWPHLATLHYLWGAGVHHCMGTEGIGTVGCMLVDWLCAPAEGE